jgi:hypothetical protein
MNHTVTVEVDPEIHTNPPKSGIQETVWAHLDTAYNLIREAAVRAVIDDMRRESQKQGLPFPDTDEELFQAAEAEGEVLGMEAPKGYRDLAAHSAEVIEAVEAAFRVLVRLTVQDARDGAAFLETMNDLPEVQL